MSKKFRSSPPTSQPKQKQETKCTTCIFRYDMLHDCRQHEQRETFGGGYRIVLSCTGYQKAGQPPTINS